MAWKRFSYLEVRLKPLPSKQSQKVFNIWEDAADAMQHKFELQLVAWGFSDVCQRLIHGLARLMI